jgi:hypothetical protein
MTVNLLYADNVTSAFHQNRIEPIPVSVHADAFSYSHNAEPACLVQRDAGFVDLHDAGLQHPDARTFRGFDDRFGQRFSMPCLRPLSATYKLSSITPRYA